MLSSPYCDLCGDSNVRFLTQGRDLLILTAGERESWGIWECRGCGLIRLDPIPSDLMKYYPENYDAYNSDYGWLGGMAARWIRRREASVLRSMAASEGDVLEIGCGDGLFLEVMKEACPGWRVYGIEPSRQAAARARQRGVEVVATSAEDFFADRQFDIIILRHVLEHLKSPRSILATIHGMTRPGGIVHIEVPNAGSWERGLWGRYWSGYDVPRHLYSFTPGILKRYLTEAGFSIERVRFSIVPNNWIMNLSYAARDRGWHRAARFFRLRPSLLALFFPIALVQAWTGQSGRMAITARRPEKEPK